MLGPVRALHPLRYTVRLMSFTPVSVLAPAAAPLGASGVLPAFARAMGARMITTMTAAAP
jgi:hypothetical protein